MAGVSVPIRELFTVGIPSLIILASVIGAFYGLDKAIDEKAADLQGQLNLLKQVQDATTNGIAAHRGLRHDPSPVATQRKLEETRAQVHAMETRQAVIEQIVTDTQTDVAETKDEVGENRALLEDIARSVGEIRRNQ